MSLLSMWREIHESIPCDFACFVLFVFSCLNLIVSWVSQMTFPGQYLKNCGERTWWNIHGHLQQFRITLRLNSYSELCWGLRVPKATQKFLWYAPSCFLFFKSPSEIAPGSVAHVIPLYSAPSASFFLTDHKVIVFWGSKKKCQLEFIGMQEKTAFLCHGNVTMLAMSCLDFEGLFFFFKDFFFNLHHFKSLYWICYNIASVLCFGLLAGRHGGS